MEGTNNTKKELESFYQLITNQTTFAINHEQDTNTMRHIREQIADILDSISDAFIVVNCKWCFTYVNSAAERLLSFKRDELIGMCLWEVLPKAIGTTFENEFHRAISEQVTVRIDGFHLPLYAWFDVSAFPSKHGLSIYFRDITEHKWLEIKQRESEIKFRTIFDSVVDGILIAEFTFLIPKPIISISVVAL